MKRKFLSLGKQPIANAFRKIDDNSQEYFFNLDVVFDDQSKLVSLETFVEPEMMFNDGYVYHSSMSNTMRDHFKSIALSLKDIFSPKKVMEIGSNDGVFIRHFNKEDVTAVEPCGNFAKMTNDMGYKTYEKFWNEETAKSVVLETGKKDIVFSANCMCHIQNLQEAFSSVESVLSDDGIFVFEDPSLLMMIQRGSYDQLYDEHAHVFSVTALSNLLASAGMEIFMVEKISVHGGSNRIYACRKGSREIDQSFLDSIAEETEAGLQNFETYEKFSKRIEKSKEDLLEILSNYKKSGKKVCSYGATSKSTTVFNYCQIDSSLIDYIVDTTPDKQGKISPGMHIPVISPEEGFDRSIDVAFLGAWNFKEEIMRKEKIFLERGGIFITHVPEVQVCSI